VNGSMVRRRREMRMSVVGCSDLLE
jgi:hypothetical protein